MSIVGTGNWSAGETEVPGGYRNDYGRMFWAIGRGGVAGVLIRVTIVVALARYLFLKTTASPDSKNILAPQHACAFASPEWSNFNTSPMQQIPSHIGARRQPPAMRQLHLSAA